MFFPAFSFILLEPDIGGEEKSMKHYIAVPCSYMHDEKRQYMVLKRGESRILAYAETIMDAMEIAQFLEETEQKEEKE